MARPRPVVEPVMKTVDIGALQVVGSWRRESEIHKVERSFRTIS